MLHQKYCIVPERFQYYNRTSLDQLQSKQNLYLSYPGTILTFLGCCLLKTVPIRFACFHLFLASAGL